MEEGEMKEEIEDEVMEEEREMKERDKEGCWVHWKSQIQLKQGGLMKDPKMMERSEWRNERRKEEEGRRVI